jgi:hypothetical protein
MIMPPGPAPKKKELRQRRNKVTTAKVLEKKKSVKTNIPELPRRKGNRKWGPEAIAFWEKIWASAMAPEFNDVDIQGLHILLDLVDEYYRLSSKELGKKQSLANEIRLQRQCFGLTPIDRMRLQWQTEKADDAKTKGQKRENERYKMKTHQVDPRTIKTAVN